MRYSQLIGVVAAVVLVISGFLNWAWYPDLQKYFTGFYSENNNYGRPAKLFIAFSVLATIFYLTPKIWAKRWNLLVCVLCLAFAFKSFILYSMCYRGICPVKQPGLWIMLTSSVIMMLAALLPDLSVNKTKTK